MKKYILLLSLSLSLFAQNPKAFAALGDVIYDDVAKFEDLKNMASMQDAETSIDSYITSAQSAKKMGLALDAKTDGIDAKSYLKVLRELSIERDTIISSSRDRFKEAIADEDGVTVNGMLSNGIINAENYKKELLNYYEEFGEDQNLSNVEPLYLEYLASLKKDDNVLLSQEQIEALDNKARVTRMREKNKAKSEALARSVEEQKKQDKKEVLDEQKKALGL